MKGNGEKLASTDRRGFRGWVMTVKLKRDTIRYESLNKETRIGVIGEQHEAERRNWQSFWSII